MKDLEVTVSCDLSWSKHIEVIVAKANKTLGLIKRMLKNSNDPKVKKNPILRTSEAYIRICK